MNSDVSYVLWIRSGDTIDYDITNRDTQLNWDRCPLVALSSPAMAWLDVLLAHIDKSAAKDGTRGNTYSGSTAWHNSARSRLALMEQDGRILLVHEKANLSAQAEPLPFMFVEGGLVPETGTQCEGLTTESFDHAEIIRALTAAHDAGINVSASLASGAYSAMKALEPLPEYSLTFRGKAGGQRAARAITALIRDGRIQRAEYKAPHRKIRERLVLVELPVKPADALENTPIQCV